MRAVLEDRDPLDQAGVGALVAWGGLARAAGYAIGTALSIISVALVTRHLGVARFGDYATALSIVTIVASVTDAGMATLAVREYTTLTGGARDEVLGALLGLRLALTLAGVLAAAAVAVALGLDHAAVVGTALAGVGVGLNVVQSMVAVPLVAGLRMGTVAVLDVGRQAVLVAAIVAVVLAGGGVLPLLGATVPAGLAGLIATVLVLPRGARSQPALARREWRRLMALTVPVALTLTTGTMLVYLVQVLTDLLATERQSGLYATAFRVIVVLGTLPGIAVAAAFPVLTRAARDDRARLRAGAELVLRTALVAGGLLALLVWAGAAAIVDILAGERYAPAADALRIQAWALLATFVVAAAAFALLSLRRHRAIVLANSIALLASAGLTAALVPAGGATAAAGAAVAAEAVLVAACLALLARDGIRLPRDAVGRVAPAVAAGVGTTVLAGLPAIPSTALAALAYLAVALATGAVPAAARDALRALWRGPGRGRDAG